MFEKDFIFAAALHLKLVEVVNTLRLTALLRALIEDVQVCVHNDLLGLVLFPLKKTTCVRVTQNPNRHPRPG